MALMLTPVQMWVPACPDEEDAREASGPHEGMSASACSSGDPSDLRLDEPRQAEPPCTFATRTPEGGRRKTAAQPCRSRFQVVDSPSPSSEDSLPHSDMFCAQPVKDSFRRPADSESESEREKEAPPKKQSLTCPDCERPYATAGGLKAHWKKKHSGLCVVVPRVYKRDSSKSARYICPEEACVVVHRSLCKLTKHSIEANHKEYQVRKYIRKKPYNRKKKASSQKKKA